MSAFTIAKKNLSKGLAPMEGRLNDLVKKEFIPPEIFDRIRSDADFEHYFKPKVVKKKK